MPMRPMILVITFVLAVAGTLAFTAGCAQPILNCTSAHGDFAAEYVLTKGHPASPCGHLPGDVLGMETYFQPGGANGTPDYEKARLAIRPASVGAMIAYAEARGVIDEAVFYDANAIGSFTAGYPDSETFCRVDEFAAASVSLPNIAEVPDDPTTPDVDESQPAQGALDVTYQWSHVRLVVSADAQGTQFEADLEYTQGFCTAEYHVVGVYPAVECKHDDDCDDDHNGINPDFAVRCNTELGLCVLDEELPAYE